MIRSEDKCNLVSTKELASFLGISEWKIRKLAKDRIIPVYRFNLRLHRYNTVEVHRALEQQFLIEKNNLLNKTLKIESPEKPAARAG